MSRLLHEHGITPEAPAESASPVMVEVGGGLTVLDAPSFGLQQLSQSGAGDGGVEGDLQVCVTVSSDRLPVAHKPTADTQNVLRL